MLAFYLGFEFLSNVQNGSAILPTNVTASVTIMGNVTGTDWATSPAQTWDIHNLLLITSSRVTTVY